MWSCVRSLLNSVVDVRGLFFVMVVVVCVVCINKHQVVSYAPIKNKISMLDGAVTKSRVVVLCFIIKIFI
jgi:hypothetical protein